MVHKRDSMAAVDLKFSPRAKLQLFDLHYRYTIMPENSTLLVVTAAAATLTGIASVGVLGYLIGKHQYCGALDESPKRILSSDTQDRKCRIGSACDVKVDDSQALVDVRISQIRPLVPPACLLEELPNLGTSSTTVGAY